MAVLFRREPGDTPQARILATGGTDQNNPARSAEISRIVKDRLVTVEFQPIVRIATGETVAFESFVRGPAGSTLATPEAMFRAAAAIGLSGELDLVAANAAYSAARFSPHFDALTIFVNTEPASLFQLANHELDELGELAETAAAAMREMKIVVEIPEQSLIRDPVTTLIAASTIRQSGARLAIDNVGAAPQALPLIAFLQPDVVKLAPAVMTSPVQMRAPVLDAVVSYIERSGGLVVAQGIEHDRHLEAALGMGAMLGQGWLFGRPTTVPVAQVEPSEPLAVHTEHESGSLHGSPFTRLAKVQQPVRVDLAMFEALSKSILDNTEACGEPFVMVVGCPEGGYLGGGRSPRLRGLGRKASLLLVLTTNTDLVSGADISISLLEPADPLREELILAVMSLSGSSLLVGRKADDDRYECMLTHDRGLILRAMGDLLSRATSPAITG